MEYQKIRNLLDNTPNHPPKFRKKIGLKSMMNHGETFDANNDFSETSTIISSLCDHSDAYIHTKGTTTIPNTGTAATSNNYDKKVIYKDQAAFANCINKIKNTQIDHFSTIDAGMPNMYNLIEYSDIYSKTSRRLWQCCRNESISDDTNNINDFLADNNKSISFKFNEKITEETGNHGSKY